MTLSTSASTPFPPHLAGEYHLAQGGELQATRGPVSAQASQIHSEFRAKILAPEFSCVAAKASFNTNCYAFGRYGELGSLGSSLALAHDLTRFTGDQDEFGSDFTSFIATFEAASLSELEFEEALWRQLRALHQLDAASYSAEVEADPQSNKFGFSFAGRGFFIIGLHPGSSRVARQFPVPALVFNAHRQFQALRDTGRFERMQQTIRGRELKLQGSLNPNLADYGTASEARQYSGRAVEPDWVAPFPTHACPFLRGEA